MPSKTARSPEEIQQLYDTVKAKKQKKGINYTTVDFLQDIGYSGRKQTFSEITADPDKAHHRGTSKAANMLMDHLEKSI